MSGRHILASTAASSMPRIIALQVRAGYCENAAAGGTRPLEYAGTAHQERFVILVLPLRFCLDPEMRLHPERVRKW